MITVNDVVISQAQIEHELPNHESAENPRLSAGHELVLRELIRQRATELNLAQNDIEELTDAVLKAEVTTPKADDAACQRYYENHTDKFRVGDLIEVQHILFQATPNVDVQRLRGRAARILTDLHQAGIDRFGDFAREYSNCPSAQEDGDLGQVARGETAPEFEAAVFKLPEHTLARELIETRHGFHIVRTGRKVTGKVLPLDTVQDKIAAWLEAASWQRGVNQYLQQLVGKATIVGIDISGSDSPLVQ